MYNSDISQLTAAQQAFYQQLSDANMRQQFLASLAANSAISTVNTNASAGTAVPVSGNTFAQTEYVDIKVYNNAPGAVDSTWFLGDDIGHLREENPAPVGVYVTGNNVNSGKRGALTASIFAKQAAYAPVLISRIFFQKNTGVFSSSWEEIEFIEYDYNEVARPASKLPLVVTSSNSSAVLPNSANYNQLFKFHGARNLLRGPISAGDVLTIRLFVSGEATTSLMESK